MRWTTGQEDVIRELGFRGAGAVRQEILRRYGVDRSEHAIEAHASRIRASLRVLDECPGCGAVGVTLNRQTGMCARCTLRAHVDEERAFHELLVAEAEGCENGPEVEALRREWARLRQENSRLRRRYGLRGKRERE